MHVKPNKATSIRSPRLAQPAAEEQACLVHCDMVGCPFERQVDAAGKAEHLHTECKLATSKEYRSSSAVHRLRLCLLFVVMSERRNLRGRFGPADTSSLIASRIGSGVVFIAGSGSM
jgi:hypothetical protein